jgi:hypothetical protein
VAELARRYVDGFIKVGKKPEDKVAYTIKFLEENAAAFVLFDRREIDDFAEEVMRLAPHPEQEDDPAGARRTRGRFSKRWKTGYGKIFFTACVKMGDVDKALGTGNLSKYHIEWVKAGRLGPNPTRGEPCFGHFGFLEWRHKKLKAEADAAAEASKRADARFAKRRDLLRVMNVFGERNYRAQMEGRKSRKISYEP